MFDKTIEEIEKNKKVKIIRPKHKLRRITTKLEYKARSNNLSEIELLFLEGLLKAQQKYPQLTLKQWNKFKKSCLKK